MHVLVDAQQHGQCRQASKQILAVLQRFGVCERGGMDEMLVDVTDEAQNRIHQGFVSNQWVAHVHSNEVTSAYADYSVHLHHAYALVKSCIGCSDACSPQGISFKPASQCRLSDDTCMVSTAQAQPSNLNQRAFALLTCAQRQRHMSTVP